jgi:AraC-like DNA-binding protein
MQRARDYLEANARRVISAEELEATCGESRFVLADGFKQTFGTSPYRYLLMRRLDQTRAALRKPCSIADVAHVMGFADQAHMTRQFKSAYGFTPVAYASIVRSGAR